MAKGTILLAAGGTGGHLFPAEALAHELVARGWEVHLATDDRVERFSGNFPATAIHRIPAATLGGRNPIALLGAFWTIWRGVRQASEVIRRHEQQLHAQLNKALYVARDGNWIKVTLEIVPAEDDPYAWLSAQDAAGEPLAKVKVAANFKLSQSAAEAWVDAGFERPAGRD